MLLGITFGQRLFNSIFSMFWCNKYLSLASKEAKATGLQYQISKLTKQQKSYGWSIGNPVGSWYIQYYCEDCKGELIPGPSGAGTNQVCEKCRINYGCLPNALER